MPSRSRIKSLVKIKKPKNKIRYIILEDDSVWKVEELGQRQKFTGTLAWRASTFPADIHRPNKFDLIHHLTAGIVCGTKEKIWWWFSHYAFSSYRNTDRHGTVSPFVYSSKTGKTHTVKQVLNFQGWDCVGITSEFAPGDIFFDAKLKCKSTIVKVNVDHYKQNPIGLICRKIHSNKDLYWIHLGTFPDRVQKYEVEKVTERIEQRKADKLIVQAERKKRGKIMSKRKRRSQDAKYFQTHV